MSRRLRAVASALLFLALAGGGVGLAYVIDRVVFGGGNESAPVTTAVVTVAPPPATTAGPPVREEPWPLFGGDFRRTNAPAGVDLRPPFRKLWTLRAGSLLEFPPVIAYNRLYFGSNAGVLRAVDVLTGEVAWEKRFGRCIAASPAVSDGVLYQPLMDPAPCSQHDEQAPGFLVALDADTGKRLWRFRAGVDESPPLVARGMVFFGTWDGKIYALDRTTHKPVWTYQTGDKVKGGAAYSKGTIYIGSYDGKIYALEAATGSLRWEGVATSGGDFYATPSVARGKVYAGSTDRNVYAFDAASGRLAWSHPTGGFVYSASAVWKKTVYVGSYDGKLYALNADTGEERWTFDAGGEISGAPVVLAGVVYVSTLARKTFALDAKTGKQVWAFPDGQYTPVVADGERVYLTGYARVYGLEPKQG